MWQTARDSEEAGGSDEPPQPGLVIVWSGDAPALMAFRVGPAGIILGRELLGPSTTDDRISRQHARLRWNGPSFSIADLGSRNGTFVGGQPIVDGEITVVPPCVVRTGRTVGVLLGDVRRFEDTDVQLDGDVVIGPVLADAWQQIARAAQNGDALLLTGESGSGKELAARQFHRSSGATGELIAVNCAAIPTGVAERLLFGAKKGAYSGADRDADGYLVAADGGTLFLDEIGELEPAVQAKLLRVLETHEVLPLGAAKPRTVTVRIVAATLRDLRGDVANGRFRDDLYYRIGRPEVRLPALRQRLEDVPWLVHREVQRATPEVAVHSTLIEACLLRPWPGNVRELVGEVRRAAFGARDAGKKVVRQEDLDASAGLILDGAIGPATVNLQQHPTSPMMAQKKVAPLPDHDSIVAALKTEDGNVTRAARALGLHRNQLRRYITKHPDLAEMMSREETEAE
jgi:transcriptional regulator with GAF, ATPase, and Fis domain